MQLGLRGVNDTVDVLASNYEIWNFDALNDFSYNRSIHGFFAEYQYNLNEKISIKPSFRIEVVNKNIIFNSSTTDSIGLSTSTYVEYLSDATFTPISIQEVNYFPDFHFTYNITDKKNIQFGLSKRIERPSGAGHHWGQLRPFPRSVYNDSFVFIGNPFLKPELSTQYEISYKSPIPMGFGYINFYMSDVKDPIEWDTKGENEEEGSSGSIITFTNAESAKNRGIELFMMIMGQTIGGGYNLNELSDPSNDYNLNGTNERINMYMRINLPEEYIKFFSYEFGFYYMKMTVPGGTLFGDKGTLWANTGISKSLFNDRASISFSINNIFDKGGFQMNREHRQTKCRPLVLVGAWMRQN
jgi:outer membrane receptor protein involved in Fe transport